MLAARRYENICARLKICTKLVGTDFLDPNYKINGLTLVVITSIAVYFTFSFYTMYEYFSENWIFSLRALCMAGSAFQGISKMATAILYMKKIRKIDQTIREICEICDKKQGNYNKAVHKNLDKIELNLKIMAYVYLIGSFLIALVPIVYVLAFGERIFVLQFMVPGLDPETNLGYIGTISVHLILLLFGAIGNFSGDMCFIVYIMSTGIFSNIFKVKFDDLNELLITKSNGEESTKMMKDILGWHQIYSSFAESLNDTLYWIIFTQVTASTFSITSTTFVLIVGEWPAGYAYIIIIYTSMLVYCILGTSSQMANDSIEYCIYDSFWYLLKPEDQKMLKLLLLKAQHPTMLTVGGIVPLSVSTALQVTKAVYSYLMILINFLKN